MPRSSGTTTDNRPLDEMYIDWLYSQVARVNARNPARTYWSLCGQLFHRPFSYFVQNDENRAQDGIDLRLEFLDHAGLDNDDPLWMELDCSILEMLIALARRVSFETSMPVDWWFGHFLDNLKLKGFTDDNYNDREVDEILFDFINRNYSYDGFGGLFPLSEAKEDQTQVEIWYQMQAYLIENGY